MMMNKHFNLIGSFTREQNPWKGVYSSTVSPKFLNFLNFQDFQKANQRKSFNIPTSPHMETM